MPDSAAQALSPQQSSYRWVIMILATASFTMAVVSRFAWPPLISEVMPVMNISRTQALAYMTAFYIGYISTQIPGGLLADRFGPRLVIGSAVALQGLAVLALGFTENYQLGFLYRIICGLGAGCIYSSCLKAIVTWFSPVQRGLAIGVVMSSLTIGLALPNVIMPYLNAVMGWQGAFRSLGLFIIILAVLVLLLMREVKIAASQRPGILEGLKFVAANRNILLISLAGLSAVWSLIGFGSVANHYMISTLDIGLVEAGHIMAVAGLTGLAMPTIAGWLAGRKAAWTKWLIIIGHLLLVITYLLFSRVSASAGFFAGACAVNILIGFLNPLYSIVVADNAGPQWMATAGGLSNTIFQFGAIVAPLLIGLASDASGHYAFTWPILAAGALLGVVATCFIRQPK